MKTPTRFGLGAAAACVALLVLGALALRDRRSHATFDTLADTRGTSYAHWLPEDMPASATDLDIRTDLDARQVWFAYDAPADAVPSSCVAAGPHRYTCGTEDRYELAYDAGDQRWSGHIGY
jgi:hypothetical protein